MPHLGVPSWGINWKATEWICPCGWTGFSPNMPWGEPECPQCWSRDVEEVPSAPRLNWLGWAFLFWKQLTGKVSHG